MTDSIGDAVVSIMPDFSGFREEYLAKLKAATARNTVEIKATLDTKELRAEYALAKAALKDQYTFANTLDDKYRQAYGNAHKQALAEQAKRNNAAARESLALARDNDQKIFQTRARAHTAALAEEARRNAAVEKDRFTLARNNDEKLQRAHQQGLADHARWLKREQDRLVREGPDLKGESPEQKQKRLDREKRHLSDPFDFLAGGQRGQVVALKALATIVAPVSAAVLGLASAFAIAGAASGIFAVAAIGHMAQLNTVMEQVKEQGQSLADLPAPFQKMLPALDSFQVSWRQFLQDTRGPVFDVFIQGLDIAKSGLEAFTPVVNIVAEGLKGTFNTLEGLTKGSAFLGFLETLKAEAPTIIQSLTQSIVNLSDGFLSIFTAFAPAGQSMLSMLEQLTASFRDWAAGLQDSTAFKNFLEYAKAEGPKVLDLISNFFIVVGKLIVAMAPVGSLIVSMVNGFLSMTAAIPTESLTAFVTVLSGFFIAMKLPALALFVAALSPVKLAFIGLAATAAVLPSQVFIPLAATVAAVWVAFKGYAVLQLAHTALISFASANSIAATGVVTLRTAIASLVATMSFATFATAIGIIAALGVAIGAIVYDLTKDSESVKTNALAHQTAATATQEHKAVVDQLTDALNSSNGVIDDNTRRTIANTLAKKGIFDDAGTDPKRALSGVLGNKEDFEYTLNYKNRIATEKENATNFAPGTTMSDSEHAALADAIAARKAANAYAEYGGTFNQAAANNAKAQLAVGDTTSALKDQSGALLTTTTLWERYSKSIALTDREQVAKAFQSTYQTLTDAHKGVATAGKAYAKAKADEAKATTDAATANVEAAQAVADSRENLADVNTRIAQDNADAAQKVVDAEQNVVDAYAASKEAVLDLAQARKDAIKALRDQADAEESTSIRLEQAKLEVRRTATRDPADLVRRQALLGLSEATKAHGDELAEGKVLRKQGVEGAPGVVSAKKDVADTAAAAIQADKDFTKAQTDQTATQIASWRARRDAQRDLNKTIADQKTTFEAGKQSVIDAAAATEDARLGVVDAASAEKLAQIEYNKSRTAIDEIGDSMGITKTKRDELASQLAKQMSLNVGNVPGQLNAILTSMEAMKLMSQNIDLTPAAAWAQAVKNMATIGKPAKVQPTIRTTLPNGNVRVSGPGGSGTQLKALGGAIWGGSGMRDDVPALLTAGEHVWTKDEVKAAGGHTAVESLRKSVKGFAEGGKVDISKLPVADTFITSGILDQAAATYGFAPKGAVTGGSLGSAAIAAAAYAAGKRAGASDRVMLALFETGIVESGFKNYANSSVPESMKIPHDAVGTDHDSVGFLQQRPGWGSVAERMDATYAANAFLRKAMRYDKDFAGTAGQLAQKVQVSAFPDRYDGVMAQARAMIQNAIAASIGKVVGAQHYTVKDIMTGLLGAGSGASGGLGGGNAGAGKFQATGTYPLNTTGNQPRPNSEGMRGWSANTWAARQFIQKTWPGIASNSYPSSWGFPDSYHYPNALDNMTNAGSASGLKRGNEIANWFASNPSAYGTQQIIWNHKFSEGEGWSTASDPHTDHVHLSFAAGKSYDTGGILPPGGIAVNTSSRPETIRNAEQEGDLREVNLSPETIRELERIFKVIVALDGKKVGENMDKRLGFPLSEYE